MENTNTQTPKVSHIPSQASFGLTLSQTIKGTPVIENAHCEFSYQWDFEKNMGSATLVSINNCELNIVLHPLGIEGYLDFMSDMKPTSYVINGQIVVLYRVILDINLTTGIKSAAIMFNEDGSCIEASESFNAERANLA